MPQKLNSIQVAKMLTNQLNSDLVALEGHEKELSEMPDQAATHSMRCDQAFSQEDDSKSKTISDDILSNKGNSVNKKFNEPTKTTKSIGDWDEPIPFESATPAERKSAICAIFEEPLKSQ